MCPPILGERDKSRGLRPAVGRAQTISFKYYVIYVHAPGPRTWRIKTQRAFRAVSPERRMVWPSFTTMPLPAGTSRPHPVLRRRTLRALSFRDFSSVPAGPAMRVGRMLTSGQRIRCSNVFVGAAAGACNMKQGIPFID